MEKNLLIKNAYIDDFLIKEIIAINKKQSEEEITFESYKKRFNKNNIIYCL